MSWRDRAITVSASDSAAGWRARAVPVDEEPKKNLSEFGENAAEDYKRNEMGGLRILKGIHDLPKDVVESELQVFLKGGKVSETPLAEDVRAVGSGVKSAVKSIPDDFKNIFDKEKWYEQPVTNAVNAGSLVFPLLKGAEAASLASKAGAVAESAAPGLAKRAFAKSANTVFGTPEEAVLARMKNPGAVKTAFAHAELADQMVGSVNNFKDTIKTLADHASETLRSSPYIEEGAFPKTKVADAIRSARRDLGGVFSQESQKAVGALKKVAEQYKKLKSTVSETQVKTLIQEIDSDIDWGNPSASRTNEALVGVRTRLDGMLKKQNPAYAEAMKPVSEASRVIDKMQKHFGIKRETGRGFVATDQTLSKIEKALKEDKLQTQDVLRKYQKISGEDWETKIANANTKKAFEGGSPNGARRVFGMGAVGTLAGVGLGIHPAVTAALGTIGGLFIDVYGRNVAGKIVDALANPKMARYVSVLEKAAIKGPSNVAAVHGLLLETDPKYSAAMKENGVKAQ